MSWWIVAPVVMIAWLSYVFIEMMQLEIDKLRKGDPENDDRGVSIFPVFPIMPFMALGFAHLGDDATKSHWGTTIALWFHVAMIVYSVVAIAYYGLQIRALRKELENKQTPG